MNRAEIVFQYIDLVFRLAEFALLIWRQWPLSM